MTYRSQGCPPRRPSQKRQRLYEAAHPRLWRSALTPKRIDRRGFIRNAAGTVSAVGALAACEPDGGPGVGSNQPDEVFFTEDFAKSGPGWGEKWLSFRYEADLERVEGAGVMRFEPAARKAVTADLNQARYMVQPVVVHHVEGADVEITVTVSLEGLVEAGAVCRASFDRCYALLVKPHEVLLCRYDLADRVVLDRAPLGPTKEHVLTLTAVGESITGVVGTGADEVRVGARDKGPLEAGLVGALANPFDEVARTKVRFKNFSARVAGAIDFRAERLLYRFAGAVVPSGDHYKARVTARTEVPTSIAFDVATQDTFADAIRTDFLDPSGDLGAVHAWLRGLDGDTTYFWRPVFMSRGEAILGAPASFRTPPPSGSAVRFGFASCTSGRVTTYSSFNRVARLDPQFYVHAGDWGYADLNSVVRSADHFQARWIRLLRIAEPSGLLATTPLLFWQDDHDYQADNGWAATVQPYAVRAFDELHANPTDDYFDIRWGDVHVFCLDCRLYATDPEASDDSTKSRLGVEQKLWLKQAMNGSDAPVLVVAAPMAFRDKVDDDPGWHNAYTTERDELLGFFGGLEATVVILSGDSHGQRLIHHFEFGELYEVTCSGTDFTPGGFQGRNDPEHTQIYRAANGIALVALDPEGPGRRVTVSVVSPENGAALLEKSLDVV